MGFSIVYEYIYNYLDYFMEMIYLSYSFSYVFFFNGFSIFQDHPTDGSSVGELQKPWPRYISRYSK